MNIINEKTYYKYMSNMEDLKSVQEKIRIWHACFSYILNYFNVGYTEEAIDSLFYNYDMQNWEVYHKDNTMYKEYDNEQLYLQFCGECSYICDRTSYDRLFRTHWLFKQLYEKQLNEKYRKITHMKTKRK